MRIYVLHQRHPYGRASRYDLPSRHDLPRVLFASEGIFDIYYETLTEQNSSSEFTSDVERKQYSWQEREKEVLAMSNMEAEGKGFFELTDFSVIMRTFKTLAPYAFKRA
jgi:hypothetical protein